MKTWSINKPYAKLIFHTKEDDQFVIGGDIIAPRNINATENIISITTSNSLNTAAGEFSVDLVYVTDTDGTPIYKKLIKPLDLLEIELKPGETLMIGIIDAIEEIISIREQPDRRIRIVGRSLGAIWLFDLIKYFPGATTLPPELMQRNLELKMGSITIDFYNQPPSYAIKKIYELLPALEISLKNKTLKDYIDVGTYLFTRRGETVFNTKLSPYSGTLFNYFTKYVNPPFYEIWTESKDGKLYLRTRPTPFNMSYDAEDVVDPDNNIVGDDSWWEIMNWINGDPSHVINGSDILYKSLKVTHSEAYSIFSVIPGSSGNFTPKTVYAIFPPLIEPDLYREVGSRDFEHVIEYIPMNNLGEVIGGTGGSIEKFKYYRNKLYLWNKDNHRFETGTVTIRGDSSIRVGDKCYMPGNDYEYYIIRVSQSWSYGREHSTTLTLTRGATESNRKLWYQHGLEYLDSYEPEPKEDAKTSEKQDPIEIDDTIVNEVSTVLNKIGLAGRDAEELVILTGAVESNYKTKEQMGGGAALSYWQIEPQTAVDICESYLKFRDGLIKRVASATETTDTFLKGATESSMKTALKYNDKLAIALCRLKYRMVPAPLPSADDPRAMASYWKNHYNTHKGKGTIERFISVWESWRGIT